MSNNESEEITNNPPEICEEAEIAPLALLAKKKSKERYESCYNDFIKWHDENNRKSWWEIVILAYLNKLAKTY